MGHRLLSANMRGKYSANYPSTRGASDATPHALCFYLSWFGHSGRARVPHPAVPSSIVSLHHLAPARNSCARLIRPPSRPRGYHHVLLRVVEINKGPVVQVLFISVSTLILNHGPFPRYRLCCYPSSVPSWPLNTPGTRPRCRSPPPDHFGGSTTALRFP